MDEERIRLQLLDARSAVATAYKEHLDTMLATPGMPVEAIDMLYAERDQVVGELNKRIEQLESQTKK
jgi:hypothetical protein